MTQPNAATLPQNSPILSVRGLTLSFRTDRGLLRALSDVSFDVPAAGTVCLVGESGSGKSVTALNILRLLDEDTTIIESGQILFNGVDLLRLREKDMRAIRGAQIAMVFQEPMTSLNPVYTIGSQIGEAVRLHRSVSRKQASDIAIDLLRRVGMPDPEKRVQAFPHELSGGMRQRVMIAMALACEPKLLIADEPTTALDVTIQAQILDLLRKIQKDTQMSVLLITHDLGVVGQFAENVVVLYAGQVVEKGPVRDLFRNPLHPYTAGLLKSIPPLGMARGTAGRPTRLPTIDGAVPRLDALPPGCRFEPRCTYKKDACSSSPPNLVEIEGRVSRCHFAQELQSVLTGPIVVSTEPPKDVILTPKKHLEVLEHNSDHFSNADPS